MLKKKMKPLMMVIMLLLLLGGITYACKGVSMHNQVAIEEARFHELQREYYSQAKSVRDAAETDSELNKQLVEIKNYPSRLLELKLVGVGRILTGIFIILVGILFALIMMPVRLAMMMKKK